MTGVIIQARVGSKRFPKKILKSIYGKTLIEHEILRIKKSKLVKKIILATTDRQEDDILEKIANKLSVIFFRGSVENVLERYYQAAKKFKIETIVRITGDCPLIDAKVIDCVISFYRKQSADYVSNVDPPTFPDGMDVEVFSFTALKKAHKSAKLPSDREHVTSYIRNHKDIFSVLNLKARDNFSNLRLTLDYPSDLVTIRNIYKKLYKKDPYFSNDDVISLFLKSPQLFKRNKNISRNLGYKKSLKEDLKWLQ